MDIETLDMYKKHRTLLQKSFVNRLTKSLETYMSEWEELPTIKQTIYRQKYDTYVTDATKKIKEEINKLRSIKKTTPDTVMQNDIEDIILSKQSIPESKNPFEWLTKFRSKFLGMNCFTRVVLFDKIDVKDLWEYDSIPTIVGNSMPELEDKPFDEQASIMVNVVSKLTTNNDKYVEDHTEEFFDTLTGQMSMNI